MFRFYVKPTNIHQKTINFDEAQSKKIRKVLRMHPGDKIEVTDGAGSIYQAEFTKITNEYSIARVADHHFYEKESNITLIQALPKNLKVEFILQKCTELGVDLIIFFESDYSQVNAQGISKEKVNRWRRIAAEASEQSRRIYVPQVELRTQKLQDIVGKIESALYLDISGKALSLDQQNIKNKDFTFFVGPEGGFSPEEKKIFMEKNFHSIKLSNNVLRSETAGMALLAQANLAKVD